MQHQVVAEGCACKHHALRHGASAKCHLPSRSLVPQPPLCSGTPYARVNTASEGIINQGDQLCLPGKVRQQEKGRGSNDANAGLAARKEPEAGVSFARGCARGMEGSYLFKGGDGEKKMVHSLSIK